MYANMQDDFHCRLEVMLSWSLPSTVPDIHDGPAWVSLSLDRAEVDPVNQKNQSTQTQSSCSLHEGHCEDDKPALTWTQGWCQCCQAAGKQVSASCGRRMGEGSLSDTETASGLFPVRFLLLLTCDHGCLLAHSLSLLCPRVCFLFLFIMRMQEENGEIPVVCYSLLKGNQNFAKGRISSTVITLSINKLSYFLDHTTCITLFAFFILILRE